MYQEPLEKAAARGRPGRAVWWTGDDWQGQGLEAGGPWGRERRVDSERFIGRWSWQYVVRPCLSGTSTERPDGHDLPFPWCLPLRPSFPNSRLLTGDPSPACA